MVYFSDRLVGGGAPCFVTFEVGPTHNGLESAKRLIRHAAGAGADAIKFQMLNPDRLIADRHMPFTYSVLVDRDTGATEEIEEPLYELLKRRAFNRDEWRVLKEYSDSLGLAFFATAGFPEEIEFLIELGCHSIKIASADVNHKPLVRQAAATGVCLQIDTGNANLGEIEAAVDLILGEGNENIIIHHCPSGYPARLEGINLAIIPTLRQMFSFPIAFSDHSPGSDMDVAAVALGVDLVEKTLTEDRTTRSIEHIMSIEPHEAVAFVKLMRDVQRAMGTPRRIMHAAELRSRLVIRRSVFLISPAPAGTQVSDLLVDFKRPGYGIGPDNFETLLDCVTVQDLDAEHQLQMSDLRYP